MGHGHVIPNPNGMKAHVNEGPSSNCGGPAICGECAGEAAMESVKRQYGNIGNLINLSVGAETIFSPDTKADGPGRPPQPK